jgi:DNA transformation protein
MVTSDYLAWALEQLAVAGQVTSRRMFGGVGLYLDGLFFALIDDDTLYFKTDDSSRPRYEQAGSRPFRPFPDNPDHVMAYWQVPADVLEDPDLLREWAREALAVALAARTRSSKRRRSARRSPGS